MRVQCPGPTTSSDAPEPCASLPGPRNRRNSALFFRAPLLCPVAPGITACPKEGCRVNVSRNLRAFRERLIEHETPLVLGKRPRSTARTSAFGAGSFQPHMALLRAGSGVQRDLTQLGTPFRQALGDLHFDRFLVETVCLTSSSPSNIDLSARHASDA